MRIKITDEAKKWLTLAELPEAKQIVKDMRDSDEDAAEYLKLAADCWLHNSWLHNSGHSADYASRVHEVSAEIAGNARAWNAYGNDSGRLDIWLSGLVETWNGFLKIGCYLTDVWNIGPEDFNREFPGFCYARYYTEEK